MRLDLRGWAERLERDILALWFAARDGRTPLAAKVLAGMVAAYALSPIDLIPDFIPVLGLLDDLLIVPLGIWLALKLVPDEVMVECRARAAEIAGKPNSVAGAVVIAAIWLFCLAAVALWLLP